MATAAEVELGQDLLARYDRLWDELGNGSSVARAMEFEPGEHFEFAAWRLPGAIRVAASRLRRSSAK